jgi:uncharacterized membrane protein
MFKNWSLRFLIYRIILEILLGIIYYNTPVVLDLGGQHQQNPNLAIQIFQFLIPLLSIIGLVFLGISIFKKEEKDFKFYIALIGHLLFLIFPLILFLLG